MEQTFEDKGMTMAYREAIAWMALAGMAIGYGPFFAMLSRAEGEPTIQQFLLYFAAASLVRVVIEVGGRIVLAVRHRAEARLGPDERDRAIAQRSTGFAYIILLTGMIVVGVVMPFSEAGIAIAGAALLVIVLAETIRYLAVVLSYRLGWQD